MITKGTMKTKEPLKQVTFMHKSSLKPKKTIVFSLPALEHYLEDVREHEWKIGWGKPTSHAPYFSLKCPWNDTEIYEKFYLTLLHSLILPLLLRS